MSEVAALMTANTLLGSLPVATRERLCAGLECVHLESGERLLDPGAALNHCYFPATALVSLHWRMRNGATAEVAVTGPEGVVGVALFMGRRSMAYGASVQRGGWALRMSAFALKLGIARDARFFHALLAYALSLIEQMSQTAACNRLHDLDQRLCRWLLLSQDRIKDERLDVTQDSIAQVLGVRREAVTHVAGRLQKAKLIRYGRGRITILDRDGLMARACECYVIAHAEQQRLQPHVAPVARARRRLGAAAFTPA